jgi:hypothetical protein
MIVRFIFLTRGLLRVETKSLKILHQVLKSVLRFEDFFKYCTTFCATVPFYEKQTGAYISFRRLKFLA